MTPPTPPTPTKRSSLPLAAEASRSGEEAPQELSLFQTGSGQRDGDVSEWVAMLCKMLLQALTGLSRTAEAGKLALLT